MNAKTGRVHPLVFVSVVVVFAVQARAAPQGTEKVPEDVAAPDDLSPVPSDSGSEQAPVTDSYAPQFVVKADPVVFEMFDADFRARNACVYDESSQTYQCDERVVNAFQVDTKIAVEGTANLVLPEVDLVVDGGTGCVQEITLQFSPTAAQIVDWSEASCVVDGRDTAFRVRGADGEYFVPNDDGAVESILIPGMDHRVRLVSRGRSCLIAALADSVEKDAFIVEFPLSSEGSETGRIRVTGTRRAIRANMHELASSVPEPTEALPTAIWPSALGGLAFGLPFGVLLGSALVPAFTAVLSGAVLAYAYFAGDQTSLTVAFFAIAFVLFYFFIPATSLTSILGLIGGVVGTTLGVGGFAGAAILMSPSFPNDREEDARWLAWQAFQKQHRKKILDAPPPMAPDEGLYDGPN